MSLSNAVPSLPCRKRPGAELAADVLLDETYLVGRRLARGGMGEVYLAKHVRLGRPLVIKVLRRAFATRESSKKRFQREAQILADLRHPNIVQVLDFNVTTEGVPYLAMELIEGPDLKAALRGGRRFEPAAVMAIIRQVASALETAHAQGIVHRDLKLENVVLCAAAGQMPVVKLIDFGISSCDGAERLTAERCVFGTPEYMAPEQARGARDEVDARTDQYALAVLAYILLTNRAPFSGDTDVAILYQILHSEPTPLGPFTGWDSAGVQSVLNKGMARTREGRYASVLALADALERAMIEGGALPHPLPAFAPPAGEEPSFWADADTTPDDLEVAALENQREHVTLDVRMRRAPTAMQVVADVACADVA